ncbi:MAG: c-type cytochrome [Rhodobacter sp.]|jgi:cytochrome c|nr:c-type cytochrome [Rhodobacter sp.]MCA3453011.1 c-type cytochrome [Rhodobacter sp.]MCA3455700.1 c-type cytochrome [Rhodobacter sp.]MCA3461584.1 c-type cytochrome [Rhodobacter sp.]MCA3464095.1 c-type cytochrome [Rhodobacter sp.]
MKHAITALTILAASSGMALAAGDAEAGKKIFNQCQTCHVVADPDGNVLAGKNAKTGPNLYGIIGRPAASYEGFKYGDGIKEAAAKGLVWDEANLTVYVQDPTKFLDEFTGNPKLKSKMVFKVKKEEDAANVAAFLASLSPAAGEAPAATE